ncbi:NifU family protein [Defluviimonas sp. SAOS-178_SWC]|uniref:NifU family protein n=1 Tax=Defluviimonas sp. SAOS-178_SWC TaxID=3121287 RepID=UPI003221B5E0
MSDPANPLRIRAQPSPRDPDTLRFLLDEPVQHGAGRATFDGPGTDAPLARALFAVSGVCRVEVDGACIHIRKGQDARWEDMKAPIAAAIRAVLAITAEPLGTPPDETDMESDARMLAAVRDLLDSRVNPSIAGHGGRVAVEGVAGGTVYLRMSGGCQGCAGSQLTLRGGVERILRAALPDLKNIVDVTDHGAGTSPFYRGTTDRADPVISPIAEPASGTPSPVAPVEGHSDGSSPLASSVRRYLESLPPSAPTISYGALARALGLWKPGSVRRITRALEDTMREDARAGRPFIAARAVSRATDGLPAKGFFDLARELSRGPRDTESERAFHTREIEGLARMAVSRA